MDSRELPGSAELPGAPAERGTGARRFEQPTKLDSLTKQPTELIPSAVVRVVWREG